MGLVLGSVGILVKKEREDQSNQSFGPPLADARGGSGRHQIGAISNPSMPALNAV
jgi:hypothetical protein